LAERRVPVPELEPVVEDVEVERLTPPPGHFAVAVDERGM